MLARRGIDVVALQEPAINNFGTSIASREWTPVYPLTHNSDPFKACSLLLIRSNIHQKQIDFPSGDMTVVQFKGNWGELTIQNIQ
jgi:hypothetical protein